MVHAPRITGTDWINSSPLQPADLEGKVVVVEFWSASYVNCQRTIPFLRSWWHKYRHRSFEMIGIHTPEFAFEKDTRYVERATKKFGIDWPVVLDNDKTNWDNFANRYWPAIYVIAPDGEIAFSHYGEGAYHEAEEAIQSLLHEANPSVKLLPSDNDDHIHKPETCTPPTPETYCGYQRGRIVNDGGYHPDELFRYQAPTTLSLHSLALDGQFIVRAEYIESNEWGASITVRFSATEVNIVMAPTSKVAVVDILLDGQPIPRQWRGGDVDKHGEVTIDSPSLYNLLSSSTLIDGILTVQVKTGDVEAYSFSFSGCNG